MIDLHLHTTVSDGRSTPEQLARRVAAAGIRICALTDHDTIGGLAAMRAAAEPLGLRVMTGIEITAVHDSIDVHMLGYFFNPDDDELATFLAAQREDRVRRVSEMLDKLAGMGIVLSRERLLKRAAKTAGKAIGRPAIAKMLVSHGHARDIADAFDRFIAAGRPAFVARRGVTPAAVIQVVRRAGGIVSFAHPGKLGLDTLIAPLAAQGLAAIEVFHPDHDAAAVEKYRTMARDLGLAVSGGSDYHGPGSGRAEALGQVTLPADAFEALSSRRLPGSTH